MNVLYNVYAAGEEMWVSMTAPANPGWKKRESRLLGPRRRASHIPLRSCRFLRQIIYVALSVSLAALRHYNNFLKFNQYFMYSIDAPVHYDGTTSTGRDKDETGE